MDKKLKSELQKKIIDYIDDNGLNIQKFAKKTGIYPSILYRFLNNQRGISVESYLRILEQIK